MRVAIPAKFHSIEEKTKMKKKQTNKGKVRCHDQSRHFHDHSGTATTRPDTVTIYSDSYNLTLTDRDGGCERRLGRDAVKCSVFFSAFVG